MPSRQAISLATRAEDIGWGYALRHTSWLTCTVGTCTRKILNVLSLTRKNNFIVFYWIFFHAIYFDHAFFSSPIPPRSSLYPYSPNSVFSLSLSNKTKQNEQKARDKNQETLLQKKLHKKWKPKQRPVRQKQNAQITQNETKRLQKYNWVHLVLANYTGFALVGIPSETLLEKTDSPLQVGVNYR